MAVFLSSIVIMSCQCFSKALCFEDTNAGSAGSPDERGPVGAGSEAWRQCLQGGCIQGPV